MDEIDIRLLEQIQMDGRITLSQLSEVLNLSRPSVAERLKRLQDRGIVEGFTARVSSSGIGKDILVIIQIGELNVPCHKFEVFIEQDPDIIECHRVTGAVSYFMKAAVTSMASLETLVDRLIPYGRVNTSVVLSSPVSYKPMLPSQS